MKNVTFEAIRDHPELIEALVADARRERSKAIGAFVAHAFRWLGRRGPARSARPVRRPTAARYG